MPRLEKHASADEAPSKTFKERKAQAQEHSNKPAVLGIEDLKNQSLEHAEAEGTGSSFAEFINKLRVAILGKTTLRAIPGKTTAVDVEQLGLIHYMPGFNIIYDCECFLSSSFFKIPAPSNLELGHFLLNTQWHLKLPHYPPKRCRL
jgi:hypothetical protein